MVNVSCGWVSTAIRLAAARTSNKSKYIVLVVKRLLRRASKVTCEWKTNICIRPRNVYH